MLPTQPYGPDKANGKAHHSDDGSNASWFRGQFLHGYQYHIKIDINKEQYPEKPDWVIGKILMDNEGPKPTNT